MPAPQECDYDAILSHPTAKSMVEHTLAMIDEKGGCKGVNLRQIAARCECAHTNTYNYFRSFDQLLWAAMIHSLRSMGEKVDQALQLQVSSMPPLRAFFKVQLDYALDHPGQYRLFWMEPLKGEVPAEVLSILESMRQRWWAFLSAQLNLTLSPELMTRMGHLIHGYFHGEICKNIARPAFIARPGVDERERVLDNVVALVDVLHRNPSVLGD
jgi:AcrR family transcriptional regulator